MSQSYGTVGPPTERTLKNVRRATAYGRKIGQVSWVWTWGQRDVRITRHGEAILAFRWWPWVEDITGPWWEGGQVFTVRSVMVSWLGFAVGCYWPVFDWRRTHELSERMAGDRDERESGGA